MNKIQKMESRAAKLLVECDLLEFGVYDLGIILDGHFEFARKNVRLLARMSWEHNSYYHKLKSVLNDLREEVRELKLINGIDIKCPNGKDGEIGVKVKRG